MEIVNNTDLEIAKMKVEHLDLLDYLDKCPKDWKLIAKFLSEKIGREIREIEEKS